MISSRSVDTDETLLIKSPDQGPEYSSTQQQDLLKTFKASALLMLYNLMESSVTNAVEAIFDELEKQSVSFDQCREEIPPHHSLEISVSTSLRSFCP